MGFANMDKHGIFGRLPNDPLHQDYQGILVHMYEALLKHVDTYPNAESIKAQMRERLYTLRLLHKAVIPAAGLWAEKLMAEVSMR